MTRSFVADQPTWRSRRGTFPLIAALVIGLTLSLLPAANASADDHDVAEVVVVHGVPGLVVDVLANGAAVLPEAEYLDTAILEVPEGDYTLAVAEPGSTVAILDLDVSLEAGDSVTVAAHLDAAGDPTLDAWFNDVGDTGVQVFHLADFMDVSLIVDGEILVDDIANGDVLKLDVPSGTILPDVGVGAAGSAEAAIGLGDVEIPFGTALLVYAVGPPGVDALPDLIIEAVGAVDFRDVFADNTHRQAIFALAAAGIIRGFPDETFRPNRGITRGQVATLLARAEELEPADGPYDFPDIEGSVHAGNIQALADAGIVTGRSDGTFGPNDPIQRDQFASVVARWLEIEEIADGPFTDVVPGSTHAGSINALAELGIVNGRTPTQFLPLANLRRDQTATIIFNIG